MKKISCKYSKQPRSDVAVIIVGIISIGSFLFYCLLLNHSFHINTQNSIRLTAFNLFSLSITNLQTTFAPAFSLFLIFEQANTKERKNENESFEIIRETTERSRTFVQTASAARAKSNSQQRF